MNGKSPLASKTVWVNGLTAAIALLTALAGQEFIAANPRLFAWTLFGVGILNVVLRFVTTEPINGS